MFSLNFYSESCDELRFRIIVIASADLACIIITVCFFVIFFCANLLKRSQKHSADAVSNLESQEESVGESYSEDFREFITWILNSSLVTLCSVVLLVGALKMSLITCKIWIGLFLVVYVISILLYLSPNWGPRESCKCFLSKVAGFAFNVYMVLLVNHFVQVLEKSEKTN